MAKAVMNGVVIAEETDSSNIETVEGNVYFAESAVNMDYLVVSPRKTVCGWKGDCNYYDVVVDGKTSKFGAWIYKDPKPAAANIKGR